MERGRDFLRSQVADAVMQHRSLLESVESHQKDAEDGRFKALCAGWVPRLQAHQRELEQFAEGLGATGGGEKVKHALGSIVGKARGAMDAMRGNDFLRLVGDVVMIRQAQDTCATFAAIGDRIGEPRLAELGRRGEREHDEMQRDFNRLIQDMFVEQVVEWEAGETGERKAAD